MKQPNFIFCVLLFILSVIGLILAFTIGFVWAILRIIFDNNKDFFREFGRVLWISSIANDQTMGVAAQHMLNDMFLKKDAPKRFGDSENETMSHILGWAKFANKLYPLGKKTTDVLNKTDENHVEKAKENQQ